MQFLELYRQEIEKCCESCNVKELYAFGSVLTEKFNEQSDIDLIVSFHDTEPIAYAEHYFALKFALENLFQRPIDLLEEKSIRNQVLKSIINNSKRLIYAGTCAG